MTATERPSPDALLERSRSARPARPAEDLPRRGARRRQDLRDAAVGAAPSERDGVDVVIGVVETHGRAETAGAARRARGRSRAAASTTRGQTLEEMDLDADPRPPARSSSWSTSSPTPTRRAAATRSATRTSRSCSPPGIDVYTTLNIQHVESLNDVVAQITRIRVRETVPDSILDRADDIEVDRPHAGRPDPAAARGQGLRAARPRAGRSRTTSRPAT